LNVSSTANFGGTTNFTGTSNFSGTATFTGTVTGTSWQRLGETVLTTATNTIIISSIPYHKTYQVYFHSPPMSAADLLVVYLNSNTSSGLYGYRYNYNGGSFTPNSSQNYIQISANNTTSSTDIVATIDNPTTEAKTFIGTYLESSTTGAVAPSVGQVLGTFATTTAMSFLKISPFAGNNLASTTWMTIYGSNN
jgi:hypothetical protein